MPLQTRNPGGTRCCASENPLPFGNRASTLDSAIASNILNTCCRSAGLRPTRQLCPSNG
jgi:hypothetical protein